MVEDSGPAARLERLMLGRGEAAYRRLVVVVGLLTGVLVVAYGLLALDVVALSSGLTAAVEIAAAVAVAVFVLLGALQFVVLGRAVERGTQRVAETTEQLERAAEEVETAAEDLEETAEEVADESADPPEAVDAARERTETAKEVADDVKAAVDEERDRLPHED
ncbi:hypothetical protein [Halomicrobium salinisoli]|uniref:hypothetical protein n=1 Tax=Halomicrobium salinisoli TaxID=2878391 RepID=UPI001CF0016E|nr:hypothetical protein [Halomicrobium salinisoli]